MIEHVKVLSKYECKRSYLGDKMPLPEFPEDLHYQGLVFLKGILCSYWTVSVQELSHVHVYMNAKTGEPVRVTEEWIRMVLTPLTHTSSRIFNEAPSPDVFELTQGLHRKLVIVMSVDFHTFTFFTRIFVFNLIVVALDAYPPLLAI